MTTIEEVQNQDNFLGKLKELEARVFELEQKNVDADSLDQFAPEGGHLGFLKLPTLQADENGVSTSGDTTYVDWWLPLNLSDDEVTTVHTKVERTISGTRYLYVGGTFTRIGGIAADSIARYNFTTRNWETVGDGTLGVSTVYSIAFDSADNLYIGGTFENASGVAAADYIAKLSGGAWTSVGGGVNAAVQVVAIDSADNVYIGGEFTNASGVAAADYIAKLSGGAWTSVGGGVNQVVYDIAFDSADNVYIGGSFTDASGVAAADYIAKLSGGAWTSVGGGVNSVVVAVAFDSLDTLYIGGSFTDAGGDTAADYIAKLVDGAWVNVGGGVDGDVLAIAFDANDVPYIGGIFTVASGDVSVGLVARLENDVWQPLSNAGGASGLDGEVLSITILESGSVVAGGSFDYVGAIKCQSIAIYCKPISEALDLIASLFELYTERKSITAKGFFGIGNASSILTIASGVITVAQSHIVVDTEAAAATDDLDTINGGSSGDILVLRSRINSRDVTLRDGVGNLVLAGNMTLDNASDTIVLMKITTNWVELARSNNA